ncbi:MAG: sugar ABC transporter permease [Devosia sp.]|nr:sugar ABC transporter permease [Devosia sp.]
MAIQSTTGAVPVPHAARHYRSELQASRLRSAGIFLIPMCIALLVVAGWPLARSIYYSFTNATLDNLYTGAKFIGLANYLSWITLPSGKTFYSGILADPQWWNAVYNTLRFGVVSVLLETVLGMLVALMLNKDFVGRGFVRAAILVPWAIPTIVSAKMWSWMLNDQFGIVNDLLLHLGLISDKIAWTVDPNTVMVSIIIVDVWKTTPFMTLLILAGLQMIPQDIYEAAKIDGVPAWKVFWRVTLPLVRPALMVAVIFRLLDAMRIFDLVYVLTPNMPSTQTMSVLAQQNLFAFNKFGYGSAESTLLFLIIAIMTILYIWLGKVNLSGGDK